jgi:hypothetical protein
MGGVKEGLITAGPRSRPACNPPGGREVSVYVGLRWFGQTVGGVSEG